MTEIYDEIFPNPPIKSVSCEIRFPTLLTIAKTIPEFQSKIRNEFTDYYTQTIPRVYKSGVMDERYWVFKSFNDTLNLKIKNSSIVLTSNDYNDFPPFFGIIKKYFENFFKLNNIDKFLRIGLRYTNIEEFEDKKPNLKRLLEYYSFAHFKFNEKDTINNFNINYSKNENDYYMFIALEYGKNPQNKYSFLFDFDIYNSEEIENDNYIKIIDNLHNNILKVFHESITEKYKNDVLRVKK